LIAQKLRPWAGFILIQPENNAMVSRELTAEEVVTYCGILSTIDSWEVRRPALTGSPPVGKGVPPPGGALHKNRLLHKKPGGCTKRLISSNHPPHSDTGLFPCPVAPFESVSGPFCDFRDRLAPLFIDSFKYNDPTEFECADDLLVRRPIAGKNHANR
jgi:hypothetical protein